MAIKSIHIVQMQIIGIDKYPFPPKKLLRQQWHPIFTSKKIFKDTGLTNVDYSPSKIKTFIPHLGECIFTARNTFIGRWKDEGYNEEYILSTLSVIDDIPKNERIMKKLKDTENNYSHHLDYLNNEKLYEEYFGDHVLFGFDPELEDQRMNYLYLESNKPIYLKSSPQKDLKAKGKIYLHIYPSGYLTLLFVTTLIWGKYRTINEIRSLIKETRPWRNNNNWIWNSKYGNLRLNQTIKSVKYDIQHSVYKTSSMRFKEGDWITALRTATSSKFEDLAHDLLDIRGEFDSIDLSIIQNNKLKRQNMNLISENTLQRLLISSKQGLALITHENYNPDTTRKFFWKRILILMEFIAIKKQIYIDYEDLLRSQLIDLKDYRLSLRRKFEREDILKFSAYDPKIPRYLSALDNYILAATPFHRRIYSSISSGIQFDLKREKLKILIPIWEEEISNWKHPTLVLWNSILTPLKTILSTIIK